MLQNMKYSFEKHQRSDCINLEMAGHLNSRGMGYTAEEIAYSCVRDDEVKGLDVVVVLKGYECSGGADIVFVVDFEDDEGCVGGFWEGVKMRASGGVADPGYNNVLGAQEVGC